MTAGQTPVQVQTNRPVVVTQPAGARNVIVPTNGGQVQPQPQQNIGDRFAGTVTDSSGQVRNFSGNLGNTSGSNANVITGNASTNPRNAAGNPTNIVRDPSRNTTTNQVNTPESISGIKSSQDNYNFQKLAPIAKLPTGEYGVIYDPKQMLAMLAYAAKTGRMEEFVFSLKEGAKWIQPGNPDLGRGIRPVNKDWSYAPATAQSPTTGIGSTFKVVASASNDGSLTPFVRAVEVSIQMLNQLSTDVSMNTVDNPYFAEFGVTLDDLKSAMEQVPDLPNLLTRLVKSATVYQESIRAGEQEGTKIRTDLNKGIATLNNSGAKE